MRWSNTVRHLKDPVINVKDNENNRWKRKARKEKTEGNKWVAQAIVKVCEVNGFIACLR